MNDKIQLDPRVKKAKSQLVFGLGAIVAIGLVVAIYFVFINPIEWAGEVTNTNSFTHTNTNVVVTQNGSIATDCTTNADCVLIDTLRDLSDCCPKPDCTYYADPNYVAVNRTVYEELRDELQQEAECQLVDCLQFSPPLCPERSASARVSCQQGLCVKEIINQ